MDKRIKYLIGLDTETCNGIVNNDKLDLSQSLVYDVGWVVTDKRGNVYKERSFIVYEIFCEMKDLMKSAYYSEKIPMYWQQIKESKRQIKRFSNIRKILMKDMKEFNIDTVFAHNAGFDLRALNNTQRYLTCSKYRFFFPYDTEIWDTLKMARQTFGRQKMYFKYCEKNNYLTKHQTPRPRLTAEILYRYITGNDDFQESHTGLEDVLIEKEILKECFKKHMKMEKRLFA